MPEYPRSPFKKTGTSIIPKVDGDALNATVIGEAIPADGRFTTATIDTDLIVTEGDIDLVHADKKLNLPSKNDIANPTINFGGDSGLYEPSNDVIIMAINGGAAQWRFDINTFGSTGVGKPRLINTIASNTIPNITPDSSDSNTGIGHAGADALSLIAGGVEGIRITENTAIYTTQLGGQAVHKTDAGAADYNPSALTSDYIITVDTTSAARAVTISAEDRDSGTVANPRIFIIKDLAGNAGANNITVSLETSGNIDGAGTAVINANYDSIALMVDGQNAFIL